MDMLKGCLAAYDLDTCGSHEQLHRRLGDHLVKIKFLTCNTAADTAAASGAPANGAIANGVAVDGVAVNGAAAAVASETSANGGRKRGRHAKSPNVRRSRAEWVEFLRSEKQKVKDGLGLTDHGLILREVCRRWALIKTQGTSAAPLLLEDHSAPDANLIHVLSELTEAEVRAGLEGHGIEPVDDHAANVTRLALAMA